MARFELNSINSIECCIYGAQWFGLSLLHLIEVIWFLYNTNTTTPHRRVGPSMWDPPSCEGLLYSCCIGVVNITFSLIELNAHLYLSKWVEFISKDSRLWFNNIYGNHTSFTLDLWFLYGSFSFSKNAS
jgi:hypothetical protein